MNQETDTTPPLNLVDLLNELVLPEEPTAISLMPQTIGWPIAAVILLGVMLWAARRLWQRHNLNAYRRAALSAVAAHEGDAEELAKLLRQTALIAYPREQVAGLYGAEWLAFLDATCDGAKFSDGPGKELVMAPYRRDATMSAGAVDALRHWISHHNAEVSL